MNAKARSKTFDPDTLWAKSRAFVDRALRARDHQDALEFHLWAALLLELLGKAALARISPTLVADPSSFPSLLFAAGGSECPEKRSIGAATVFERLTQVHPGFDDKLKRQSLAMAVRRNAELHSGESPTAGVDPRSWVPSFWRCAEAILQAQGRTIPDWVGADEGQRIATILADASKLLAATVAARVQRMGRAYDAKFAPGSAERADAQVRSQSRGLPHRLADRGDEADERACPACGSKAWLFFYITDEEVDENGGRWDEAGLVEDVTISYAAEAFDCIECGLELDGLDELRVVDLDESFQRTESRECTYEEDYGNE